MADKERFQRVDFLGNVRELMEQQRHNGISLSEEMRRVNPSRGRNAAYNVLEKGNPNLDTITDLAKALDVPVARLFRPGKPSDK